MWPKTCTLTLPLAVRGSLPSVKQTWLAHSPAASKEFRSSNLGGLLDRLWAAAEGLWPTILGFFDDSHHPHWGPCKRAKPFPGHRPLTRSASQACLYDIDPAIEPSTSSPNSWMDGSSTLGSSRGMYPLSGSNPLLQCQRPVNEWIDPTAVRQTWNQIEREREQANPKLSTTPSSAARCETPASGSSLPLPREVERTHRILMDQLERFQFDTSYEVVSSLATQAPSATGTDNNMETTPIARSAASPMLSTPIHYVILVIRVCQLISCSFEFGVCWVHI